jgi:hypothetical protein
MTIRPYAADLAPAWNAALAETKTPLFLFDRGYMDYHSDRFVDCSAVGTLDGQIGGLFPASIDRADAHVTSHAGLTFGGPLFVRSLRSGDALELVARWLEWLRERAVARITVKLIPPAFARYPADEVAYALWRHGFALVRRDFSSLLPLKERLPFNSLKVRSVKKAAKAGVELRAPSVGQFHDLLRAVLNTRYQVDPVHSADELALLISRFPGQIKAHGAFLGGDLLGATLVFNYGRLWHTQYLAVSEAGRDRGALDSVIADVIRQAEECGVLALSFGTSSEQGGTALNEGLLWQKESYGARALVHDFMSLAL